MEKALAIIGAVLIVIAVAAVIYYFYCRKKGTKFPILDKEGPAPINVGSDVASKPIEKKEGYSFSRNELIFLQLCILVFVIGGLLANLGAMFWPRDGEGHAWIDSGIPALGIIGTILFFIGVGFFSIAYYVHFWKTDLNKEQSSIFHIAMYAGALFAVIGFLLAAEGISRSEYFSFPLYSVIKIGNLSIAFYGILIVIGACLAYGLADHRVYQYTGEHGLLDSTFLVAFPAGIICARIGYVIGNWNLEFASRVANGDWTCIFAIWEGGLTILGGAIGGIIVGGLWFWWRHPSLGVRFGIECVVPGILLAQAIGRWGNFFNQEVYGLAVDNLNYLPYWLAQNMYIDGSYRVPLFLIESVLNIGGYFLIWYGLRNWLKKWHHWGDCLGYYLVWYGVVRIIMEPFRDPQFNMGDDGNWSIIWSAVYIVLGVLWLVGNHVYDYIRKRKGLAPYVPTYTKPRELEKKEASPKVKQPKPEIKLDENKDKNTEDDDDEWDD